MRRIAALCVALVVIAVATGCSLIDDAARAGMRSGGDDALRAGSMFGDELARSSYISTSLSGLGSDIGIAARSLTDDGELEDALVGLGWAVACDVVTGEAPADVDAVAEWVVQKGADFGIEFLGGGAAAFAAQILTSLGENPNPTTNACNQIVDSGI